MINVSYAVFETDLVGYMDQVVRDRDHLLITRISGQQIVMMPASEFESWLEICHERSSS